MGGLAGGHERQREGWGRGWGRTSELSFPLSRSWPVRQHRRWIRILSSGHARHCPRSLPLSSCLQYTVLWQKSRVWAVSGGFARAAARVSPQPSASSFPLLPYSPSAPTALWLLGQTSCTRPTRFPGQLSGSRNTSVCRLPNPPPGRVPPFLPSLARSLLEPPPPTPRLCSHPQPRTRRTLSKTKRTTSSRRRKGRPTAYTLTLSTRASMLLSPPPSPELPSRTLRQSDGQQVPSPASDEGLGHGRRRKSGGLGQDDLRVTLGRHSKLDRSVLPSLSPFPSSSPPSIASTLAQ